MMEPWKHPILFYGASLLPVARAIDGEPEGRARLQRAAKEASRISCENPLFMMPDDRWDVPSFREAPRFRSMEVIALQVVLLWVFCGEDEAAAAPLVEAWPIREMVLMAKTREVPA